MSEIIWFLSGFCQSCLKKPAACGKRQTAGGGYDLFDGDFAFRRKLLGVLLRQDDGQNAGFVLRLYVFSLHVADAETAGAHARAR